MEVHSPVVAKRLWNVMRITFFMIRKGLISKRKMIMDMNLMMKKGNVRKSLSNLMSSHHHHHNPESVTRGGLGVHYEFSCSNSPNPVFFHMPKRKHHFNFPCIHTPEVLDDEHRFSFEVESDVPKGVVTVPKTPEYMYNIFVPGEKSPLLSPFSVRVSNYSALDESEEIGNDDHVVDDQAEDFIRKFHDQLRSQSPVQFLGY
ncbi:hypothetical protein PHAVU_001G098600 [Phaseolus vulgaris]|uniref:Uncharacterized protein n=1 Tax=Phaseolus vulgaris TaxID=3885 RepID=V7CUE7_PHAVU|nr:hypothetical protein PHAVU_001G098600g [Phaseolus vulgaris]ESW33787.1 hypothetical protein PHAVU_001G098600g [Phaseolus vulgaris]